MTEYNCQKRPLKAMAAQWRGDNLSEFEWLDSELIAGKAGLMIRHSPGDVNFLPVGSWIVRQQNGIVKVYDDAKYNLLYEPL